MLVYQFFLKDLRHFVSIASFKLNITGPIQSHIDAIIKFTRAIDPGENKFSEQLKHETATKKYVENKYQRDP